MTNEDMLALIQRLLKERSELRMALLDLCAIVPKRMDDEADQVVLDQALANARAVLPSGMLE